MLRLCILGGLCCALYWPAFGFADDEAAYRPVEYLANCENFLDGHLYAPSNRFNPGTYENLTLKPEAGSLEDRFPGVVKEILSLGRPLQNTARNVEFFRVQVARVKEGLRALAQRHHDPVLGHLIEDVWHGLDVFLTKPLAAPRLKAPLLADLSQKIYACLWEMSLASLFHGQNIYLNFFPSEAMPQIPVTTDLQLVLPTGKVPNREIDIAIEDGGRWRWIEVKNWSIAHTQQPDRLDKLTLQAARQREIAAFMPGPVELITILRYGALTADDLAERGNLGFDRVLFVFPAGP